MDLPRKIWAFSLHSALPILAALALLSAQFSNACPGHVQPVYQLWGELLGPRWGRARLFRIRTRQACRWCEERLH